MFKKYALVALTVAAGVPVVAAPSEKQQLQAIKNRAVSPRARFTQALLEQDATVADLLTSTVRGHTGFNVPTMPETVDKFFMRSAPMSMKSYSIYQKLACGAEVTSAGVLRFMKNAHLLFFDKSTGRLSPLGLDCQFAVQEALKAHRVWYSKKSEFALMDLKAKEDEVFKFLQLLPLNDAKVKMLTENLLSTSDADHNRMLGRTTVTARGNDFRATKAHPKGWFRGVSESVLKNAVLGFVAFKAAKRIEPVLRGQYASQVTVLGFLLSDPNATSGSVFKSEDNLLGFSLLVGAATFLVLTGKDLYDWKTNYNLTPEPNGGVNLQIKLKEPVPVGAAQIFKKAK